MKATTSRDRFDERRRFTGVGEQMGRVRLDADANELTTLWRTEHLRRSGDLTEGSPDDGFMPALTHLIDPVGSLQGWSVTGLPDGDDRLIRTELGLTRRDTETLPRVVRVRGVTAVERRLPGPVDLLRLPVPLSPAQATYPAAALVLAVRFVWPRGDEEVVATRVLLRAADGTRLLVDAGLEPASGDGTGPGGSAWLAVRVDAIAALPRTPLPDGGEAALLAGWGLAGLPPRAEVYIGGLLADPALDESDVVLRGGDGTMAGAGRIYTQGRRSFVEHDWRYSLQPDLPDPAPLARPDPVPLADGTDAFASHLLYLDVNEVEVHAFQDDFVREPALDGEDPTFRTRQLTQVRAVLQPPDARGLPPRDPGLAPPTGSALLTTEVPRGALPDRFPVERADPSRDACLFTENASTGEGYTGSRNLHVRIEVLGVEGVGVAGGPRVVGWSRTNAATVVPLRADAPAGAVRILVDPQDAARFTPGDVVVVEDRGSRLDPGPRHVAALRRLRAVDSSEGVLEFEPLGHTLTADPQPLPAGGGLPRGYGRADAAGVRRWDGADWLVTGARYALADGLSWAFSGGPAALTEYWTFTARVVAADGAAVGVVERLTDASVHGPLHVRTPIGRVLWTATGREVVDLRRLFLPMQDVRDRLVELGRRRLSPGAFTMVVGDGVTTFGDIDQNLLEGVTGDEAIQAAVDLLGPSGGTVYIRKGDYRLEHPVLLTGRSNVRVLGDGDATVLTVTGAGGAFHVDWCGHDGGVSIELMRLVESPAAAVPFGAGTLGAVGGPVAGVGAPVPPAVDGGLAAAVPLLPADLPALPGAAPSLVDQLAGRIRVLDPFAGRAAASVVRTVTELRRLQRLHPGRPLEETAPDQLAVLNGLPHGVVTVTDSTAVTLERLDLVSREPGDGSAPHAAVLLSGTLAGVAVRHCRMAAPSGVLALPYARYLLPLALLLRPRAGLQVTGLSLSDNRIRPLSGVGDHGVRVADGVVQGIAVDRNDVDGFDVGIALEDQAEQRFGEPVDRTVVRGNRVVGASRTGIAVTGDGMEIDDNEVRLSGGTARVRAGIRVAGVACRVRGNWVSLPAAAGRPVLGVDAGVLVGDGLDDGDDVARAVLDVEVTGNRFEGAGAASAATGVLVGGPQAISQVSVTANTLRELGGAGVRAWGYLGVVAELTVDRNAVQAVALADLAWTAEHVAAAAALAPGVSLAGAQTPRDVLDRLLAPGGGDRRPAIDGVLSWLEQATVRGGVVLNLVDGALVTGNRISDVGTRLQGQPVPVPDSPVQTAGVAVLGGSEIAVRGNAVERVRGVVVITPAGPFEPPIFRPPVLDVLRRLDVVDPGGAAAQDVHGSVVAVRRQLMEYAAGGRAARQRLGGRVYATMDAVTAALEQTGSAGQRLAVQLAESIDAMRDAQGTAGHTLAANLTRAVLSDAAQLTATSPDAASAWDQAARFDHALLGGGDELVEAAAAVAEAAPTLLTGLEDLGLDVTGQAGAVVAGEAGAALGLAATLGTVAEGRAKSVALARSIPVGGPSTRDTTLLAGTVALTLEQLQQPGAEQLTDAALQRLEQGGDALAATLDTAHVELAGRLRADIGTTIANRGRGADVSRLVVTLHDIQRFAADPAAGLQVREADIDSQRARFDAELTILTADRVRRQVAELGLDTAANATRGLRLLQRSTAQLVNLVADRPESVRRQAAVAAREVAAAVEDPDRREEHRAAARAALQALQDEQARLTGVAVTAAGPDTSAAGGDPTERLAALAGLLADLDGVTDAGVRAESLGLLERQIRRTAEVLGLSTDERASVLSRLAAALPAVSEGRAAGAGAVAALLDELADRAARADGAQPATLATRTLIGALTRAGATGVDQQERLLGVQRWVATSADTLSPQAAAAFSTVGDLAGAMGAVRAGLIGLLPVSTFVPRPLPVQQRSDPQPADGVFTAAVSSGLVIAGNQVRTSRAGAVVTGSSGHPLAPVADGSGLALTVEGNRIVGAVLVGMDLRPAGVSQIDVIGNELSGCCGLAEAGDRSATGAVLGVAGTGQLVLARNRLRGNGDPQWGRLLHEITLDWRGDVTVSDNVVRHAGAGAGGAGLLVLTDPMPSPDLVRRLAQEPALAVEPPTPPAVAIPPGGVVADIPDLLRAGLGDRLQSLGSPTSVGVGAFRISVTDARPTIEKLQFAPSVPGPGPATMAAAELAHFHQLDVAAVAPLLEIIHRLPPILILPFRPQRRSVHVSGNDVVAAGPALLVLADGPNLASVTVVGNELESSGAAGAAYLRNVDTTVFATNRCECLPGVTVAVLRGRRSVLTVTGNVVLGGQPALPPPHPLPPVRPIGRDPGDLTLSVAVGPEASLSLPLDAAAMLEVLDRPATTVFADRAAEAEVLFGQFAKRADVTVDPRIRQILATGVMGRLVRLGGGGASPLVLRPRLDRPTMGGGVLPSTAPGEAAAAGDAAAAEEAAATPDETVTLLLDATNRILNAPELDGVAKLYGVATSVGMTTLQARTLVHAQLTAAGGDAEVALARGLAGLTGIEDTSPAGAAAGPTPSPNLLEGVLGLALRSKLLGGLVTGPPIVARPPVPAPVDPRTRSLVVLGGSRVGVLNNITTAGVVVLDAAQTVENNL